MNCTSTSTSSAPIWAGERQGMGWLLSDLLWERWMDGARIRLIAGEKDDAGQLWRAADDIASTFADNDPRRAASLDAVGALAVYNGNSERAEQLYRKALAAWQAADGWVEVMGTAQSARSSTFHLRLELKYPGAYPEITRARHFKTCAAGRAGTLANLATLADDRKAMQRAMAARRDAFGKRESGAAAMAEVLGETVEARVMDRWAERPPQRYDDERRLYAAALLAPVLAAAEARP